MYRTSEKLLTTGRNLLHAVWNASHCDRWNFWRQLKTCYGGKDEIAPRGYTGLADDTLGSRGPGSASSLLGITCFYHPFDSTEQSILPAVWKITWQAVFGKPVAESLPDEANGTDLSGGKSAENQHTTYKASHVWEGSQWNRGTQRRGHWTHSVRSSQYPTVQFPVIFPKPQAQDRKVTHAKAFCSFWSMCALVIFLGKTFSVIWKEKQESEWKEIKWTFKPGQEIKSLL